MSDDGASYSAISIASARRPGRRVFLRGAAWAGLGAAGAYLAACRGSTTSTSAPEAARPSGGSGASVPAEPTGRMVYGITAVPNQLEPGNLQTAPSTTPMHAIWDVVARLNPFSGQVEPGLAESWQTVDGKTVDFKLRRGTQFHNGREIVAEDVKFSVERLLDPANKLIVGNLIGELERVEVIDAQTARVVAKATSPTIPLAMTRVHVLPAQEFKAAGSPEAFYAKPIGSGPYQVKEFGRESFVELTVAPNSWRKPKLAEIRLQALTEDSARIAALKSGQADLIDGVPPDQIKGLETGGFKPQIESLAANYALDVYGPADTPHAKLEVRRAIAHAIDWGTIVKEINLGNGRISNGLIGGPGCLGWAEEAVKYPYNPARARELLAQAGFPNGFKTNMMSSRVIMTNAVPIAEAIVNYLKEVKIEVSLQLLEAATNLQFFLATYDKGRTPLFVFRHSFDLRMDVAYQLVFYDDERSIHKYGWVNKDFTTLLANAQAEMDAKKRGDLLLQANRMMADNAITITGFQPPYIAVHSPRLSGVKARPDGIMWLDDVAKAG